MNEENKNEMLNEDADSKGYSDISVGEDNEPVPLNFDYYKPKESSRFLKFFGIILFAGISFLCLMKIFGLAEKMTEKPETVPEAVYDYMESPFAYDKVKIGENTTEDGLSYTVYENHVRITGFRDILIPLEFVIPPYIEGKPVAEIDYYVFSYCAIKSLMVMNPDCIFFDDGTTPPVAQSVMLIGRENSNTHEIAEKYGNPFIPLRNNQLTANS